MFIKNHYFYLITKNIHLKVYCACVSRRGDVLYRGWEVVRSWHRLNPVKLALPKGPLPSWCVYVYWRTQQSVMGFSCWLWHTAEVISSPHVYHLAGRAPRLYLTMVMCNPLNFLGEMLIQFLGFSWANLLFTEGSRQLGYRTSVVKKDCSLRIANIGVMAGEWKRSIYIL